MFDRRSVDGPNEPLSVIIDRDDCFAQDGTIGKGYMADRRISVCHELGVDHNAGCKTCVKRADVTDSIPNHAWFDGALVSISIVAM